MKGSTNGVSTLLIRRELGITLPIRACSLRNGTASRELRLGHRISKQLTHLSVHRPAIAPSISPFVHECIADATGRKGL